MNMFDVREAQESDIPFIYSTWLKGLRYGFDIGRESKSADSAIFKKNKDTGEYHEVFYSGIYRLIDQDIYFERYHEVIERILERPGVYVSVACLTDDPHTILGYAVREGEQILHYVHVKHAFRNFGIAKNLCAGGIKTVTHLTKIGAAILKEKLPKITFNPFL